MDSRRPPTRFIRRPPSQIGLVVATLAYQAALIPSLLPRALMFLVLLAALGTVGGYALGCIISWLINRIPWIRRHHVPTKIAWILVIVLWLLPLGYTPFALALQSQQQAQLSMPEPLPGMLVLIGLTFVASVIFIVIGRSLRLITAVISSLVLRIPALSRRTSTDDHSRSRGTRVARAVIALALILIGVGAGNLGYSLLVGSYDSTNASSEGQNSAGVGTNSGGKGSLVAWDTLGREGRYFVSNPMTPTEITAITDLPAVEPLRLYVGMQQAETPEARAQLAVQEIDRSGAWDRDYLAIMVTTGTGWVDPDAINSLETVTNGDIASVALQYSAVPSWIGFVIDPGTAQAQGSAQVQAIVNAWKQRPADARPELILFGESLGAFASQAAWPEGTTPDQVAADISKVIWVGPPAKSRLWEQWTSQSTTGPAWQRVIGDGELVRVYVTAKDLAEAPIASGPAITYVAHANDPVVYWSPSLFLNEPAWSLPPLGPGVDSYFRWYPGITFLSVGFDLIQGGAPAEVGHNYSANLAPAIALTVGSQGWTKEKTARLEASLPGLRYTTG